MISGISNPHVLGGKQGVWWSLVRGLDSGVLITNKAHPGEEHVVGVTLVVNLGEHPFSNFARAHSGGEDVTNAGPGTVVSDTPHVASVGTLLWDFTDPVDV
jgi:hypothetical protein